MSSSALVASQAIIQITRFGLELADRYSQGLMSDEEFERELKQMHTQLDEANRRWKVSRERETGK